MQGALAGVRVLDLTEYVAGPFCGQMLADMGADVTKIEPPMGDFWRLTNPVAHNESRGFISVNRGKRSVVIDLKSPEGQAIVHKAVLDADVVLASYRPGVAGRLRVDYETLSKLNPRIIYAENTAFGTDGPYAHKAGFDLVAQAMTGIVAFESQTNFSEPRSITTAAITDFVSGTFLAYAVVSALYQREQTGRGQRIESSLFAAGLTLQYRPLLSIDIMDKAERDVLLANIKRAHDEGRFLEDPRRDAGYESRGQPATATNPYYGIYRTQDTYMVIACLNNRLRRAAAGILGVDDPRVKTNEWDSTALDIDAAAALTANIRETFASKSAQAWCDAFDAAGIPCGPVRLSEELYDDPHAAFQNLILQLEHPVVGDIRMPNLPVRLSDADVGATTSSPALGQHTVDWLSEQGYGESEIERLKQAGVVKGWE
jgi:formyl-CoA transferase